ncbi:MAG: hypothetical protein ABJB40_02720 [Acidobacteriota bacterium]
MSDLFISIEQAESDLLAGAAYLGERIKSSDGHAEAMNAIVPRYLGKGDVDLAAELANAIDDPFSRDKLLIIVAEKCADLDDDEYALQLADAIEDVGMQAQAFEWIGLVIAAKGHAERAAEVADSMANPDFVYAAIAINQASSGNDAGSDKTLEQIEYATARASALQQIASAKIEKNETEKAVDLLDRAAAATDEIEHDEEKIRALCEIGNLYVEAKRNDKAVETFDKARGFAEVLDNFHHDYFLVTCSLGFLFAGSSDLADRTLDLVTDKTQIASALLGFARDHWKKEEKDDAIDTLEEAYAILKSQRETETRDSRARNGLLASIAAQFAGFGKSDRGVETALEIQDPSEQTAALSQIAQVLTIQKEDDLARQAINSIAEDGDRLFALISMSDAKEELEEPDAARSLLAEAATLAETVPQLGLRSSALNEIAARFVRHGKNEEARNISLENLHIISEIRDESSQAVSLAHLSGIYEQANFELTEPEKAIIQSLTRKS